VDVLAFRISLVRILGLNTESVSTKVITLSLEKVGREVLGAIAVVEAEGSAESRGGNAPKCTLGDDAGDCQYFRHLISAINVLSPAGLCLVNSLGKEVVEEQVLEVRVSAVTGSL